MARLPDEARLLAIALLNISDDEGFLLCDPALLRGVVWAYAEDSTKARRALDDLSRAGWIELSEHPTHGVIGKVVNFAKHQRVDRPTPSKIKAYHQSPNTRRTLDEPSLPEQGTGNREWNGNSTAGAVLVASTADDASPGDEDKENTLTKCPHQKIIALYAEILPEQPQPRAWEGQRAKNLSARWRWVLTAKRRDGDRYAQTESEGLDFFRKVFEHTRKSDFLMQQWTGWDLGWLMKAENFEKVIAGNYQNREVA